MRRVYDQNAQTTIWDPSRPSRGRREKIAGTDWAEATEQKQHEKMNQPKNVNRSLKNCRKTLKVMVEVKLSEETVYRF